MKFILLQGLGNLFVSGGETDASFCTLEGDMLHDQDPFENRPLRRLRDVCHLINASCPTWIMPYLTSLVPMPELDIEVIGFGVVTRVAIVNLLKRAADVGAHFMVRYQKSAAMTWTGTTIPCSLICFQTSRSTTSSTSAGG